MGKKYLNETQLFDLWYRYNFTKNNNTLNYSALARRYKCHPSTIKQWVSDLGKVIDGTAVARRCGQKALMKAADAIIRNDAKIKSENAKPMKIKQFLTLEKPVKITKVATIPTTLEQLENMVDDTFARLKELIAQYGRACADDRVKELKIKSKPLSEAIKS